MKNFTRWLVHLICTFSPRMGYFYLAWGLFTSCGRSHLMWGISPHMVHFHLTRAFSPCVGILTSCGRHTSHAPLYHHHVSHLTWTLPWQQTSHLLCTLCAPLHTKIIFFTSCGKIPKIVTKQPQFHQ